MLQEGHHLAEAAKRGDSAEFTDIYSRSSISINHRLRDGEV